MGLIDYARERRYVCAWRLRYWWLDTESGRRAHIVAFCLACLIVVLQLLRMAVAAHFPPPAGEPVKAIYWWVVQLIIMVIAAAVSYAMRPKPESQKQRQVESPTVEDGTVVKDHGGTVWIEHEDNFLLAWKVVGQDAIKQSGGK